MPRKKIPIELGDLAADKVSGMNGVVTSIATYLYGETMFQLTIGYGDMDRGIRDHWFPTARLRKLSEPKKK